MISRLKSVAALHSAGNTPVRQLTNTLSVITQGDSVCHAVPPINAWPLGRYARRLPLGRHKQASEWFTPQAWLTSSLSEIKLRSVCVCVAADFVPCVTWTARIAAGVGGHRETVCLLFRTVPWFSLSCHGLDSDFICLCFLVLGLKISFTNQVSITVIFPFSPTVCPLCHLAPCCISVRPTS